MVLNEASIGSLIRFIDLDFGSEFVIVDIQNITDNQTVCIGLLETKRFSIWPAENLLNSRVRILQDSALISGGI